MLNRILVIDGTYLAYKSYYATLHNPVAVLIQKVNQQMK